MVQKAVQALGERQRTALILSKFDGLSYQEIADTMDLTVKAVKSLLSRARVNLKLLLQPYIDDGRSPSGSDAIEDSFPIESGTDSEEALPDNVAQQDAKRVPQGFPSYDQ